METRIWGRIVCGKRQLPRTTTIPRSLAGWLPLPDQQKMQALRNRPCGTPDLRGAKSLKTRAPNGGRWTRANTSRLTKHMMIVSPLGAVNQQFTSCAQNGLKGSQGPVCIFQKTIRIRRFCVLKHGRNVLRHCSQSRRKAVKATRSRGIEKRDAVQYDHHEPCGCVAVAQESNCGKGYDPHKPHSGPSWDSRPTRERHWRSGAATGVTRAQINPPLSYRTAPGIKRSQTGLTYPEDWNVH